MRLIDADALCEELQKEFGSPEGHRKLMKVNYIITHAPTIEAEPVRQGKWLPHPTENDWRVCSACGLGTEIVRHEAGATTEYNYKHCPWCGAKMDGEE